MEDTVPSVKTHDGFIYDIGLSVVSMCLNMIEMNYRWAKITA